MPQLTVREIEVKDIDNIIQYWLGAEPQYLLGMGVDLLKMPTSEQWYAMLHQQVITPYPDKQSYCTIWELDGRPVGHCNVNKIIFGQEAYMHLHIWHPQDRKLGAGTTFIKKSLPFFFKNLQLKKIYCEPYALNAAPNNTLAKAGFHFVKEYVTTPGSLNFEQPVKLWEITANSIEAV